MFPGHLNDRYMKDTVYVLLFALASRVPQKYNHILNFFLYIIVLKTKMLFYFNMCSYVNIIFHKPKSDSMVAPK